MKEGSGAKEGLFKKEWVIEGREDRKDVSGRRVIEEGRMKRGTG